MTAQTNYAVAPGAYLEEWAEDQEVFTSALAVLTGLDRDLIRGILNAHTPITEDIAENLAELTLIPAGTWLRYETQYRADQARLTAERVANHKPTYQALKSVLASLQRPSGILPNTATDEEIDKAYKALMDYYPAGTRVSATWYDSRDVQYNEGVIDSTIGINNTDPSFHINFDDGKAILLPGSLITKI